MTMATRLVVMSEGEIQQVGAPTDVYDFPNNIFFGGFSGSPAMNFLYGKIDDKYFVMNDIKILIAEAKLRVLREQDYVGKEVVLGIRSEDIHDELVFLDASPETKIDALIDVSEFMGSE